MAIRTMRSLSNQMQQSQSCQQTASGGAVTYNIRNAEEMPLAVLRRSARESKKGRESLALCNTALQRRHAAAPCRLSGMGPFIHHRNVPSATLMRLLSPGLASLYSPALRAKPSQVSIGRRGFEACRCDVGWCVGRKLAPRKDSSRLRWLDAGRGRQ